jgi:hypothetical protein
MVFAVLRADRTGHAIESVECFLIATRKIKPLREVDLAAERGQFGIGMRDEPKGRVERRQNEQRRDDQAGPPACAKSD